ncbi:hypothetical protein TBR22_A43470 [Luteitalea sp. TBR-22]|nr:hypothetical protein TBR22_A43470 [Luteitalea sp. TBR-22]
MAHAEPLEIALHAVEGEARDPVGQERRGGEEQGDLVGAGHLGARTQPSYRVGPHALAPPRRRCLVRRRAPDSHALSLD